MSVADQMTAFITSIINLEDKNNSVYSSYDQYQHGRQQEQRFLYQLVEISLNAESFSEKSDEKTPKLSRLPPSDYQERRFEVKRELDMLE